VLLRLGFPAWVNEKRREEGLFLFDDIEPGAASDRLSSIFGGRFASIRKGLGIFDDSEDFYALRRTFNSRLAARGVKDSDCAALLGHKQRDITNLHYTDRELGRLRVLVDAVDYHFEIEPTSAWGFPVLKACRLDEREKVAVAIERQEDGNPARVSIAVGGRPFVVDIAPVASWPCFGQVVAPDGALSPEAAATALMTTLGDRAPKFADADDAVCWEQLMSYALAEE
jgi:hypothetical protein